MLIRGKTHIYVFSRVLKTIIAKDHFLLCISYYVLYSLHLLSPRLIRTNQTHDYDSIINVV